MFSKKMIPGIPDQYSRQILDILSCPSAAFILFGSRAKGNYREGSDIDIAIKGAQVTLQNRDAWLTKYEALNLPWKLDLVIYHLIEEPALKEHIDRVGIQIL